jgi:hypothetical protein
MRVPVKVIPPVALAFTHEVALFAPGSTHAVTVVVTAARAEVDGVLSLVLPPARSAGPPEPGQRRENAHLWTTSGGQAFHLTAPGQRVELTFQVTAPPDRVVGDFSASAEVGGVRYDNQRIEIRYEHIPAQLLQPAVKLRAVSLDLAIRGQRIGCRNAA